MITKYRWFLKIIQFLKSGLDFYDFAVTWSWMDFNGTFLLVIYFYVWLLLSNNGFWKLSSLL